MSEQKRDSLIITFTRERERLKVLYYSETWPRERETDKQTDRQTDRQKETERDRERQREKETERDRE